MKNPDTAVEISWTAPELARRLRERFHAAPFVLGDLIPSERSLSIELQVHRSTMRRALNLLGEQGVLERSSPRSWAIQGAAPARSQTSNGAIAVLSHWARAATDAAPGGVEPAVERAAMEALHGSHRDVLYPHIGTGLFTEKSADLLARLQTSGVVGVIVSQSVGETAGSVAALRTLRATGLHVVCQGQHEYVQEFDRAFSDPAAGAKALVAWLVGRGSQRILRVWPQDSSSWWLSERDRGYEDGCTGLGIPVLPALRIEGMPARASQVDSANQQKRIRHIAGWLCDQLDGVDALMTVTDWDALAIAGALRLLGRSLPIVGYDQVWHTAWESALMPGIPSATIDKRNDRVGAAMVSILLRRIAGEKVTAPIVEIVVPELSISGGSEAGGSVGD